MRGGWDLDIVGGHYPQLDMGSTMYPLVIKKEEKEGMVSAEVREYPGDAPARARAACARATHALLRQYNSGRRPRLEHRPLPANEHAHLVVT